MIKKIDILGLQLDNQTVREAIMKVDTYFSNDMLNTIESVSVEMLLEAEKDSVIREAISSMDLTIIGEKEIMQAVNAATMQRVQEIKENDFVIEFFRRVERNKKSLFLLGETDKKIAHAKEELQRQFPKLNFAGEYALENCVGDFEAVINEMNITTPDVILSVLATPLQEHFLMSHKDKINANIWYGIGETKPKKKRYLDLRGFFQSRVYGIRLKNSIDKYKSKNENEA